MGVGRPRVGYWSVTGQPGRTVIRPSAGSSGGLSLVELLQPVQPGGARQGPKPRRCRRQAVEAAMKSIRHARVALMLETTTAHCGRRSASASHLVWRGPDGANRIVGRFRLVLPIRETEPRLLRRLENSKADLVAAPVPVRPKAAVSSTPEAGEQQTTSSAKALPSPCGWVAGHQSPLEPSKPCRGVWRPRHGCVKNRRVAARCDDCDW